MPKNPVNIITRAHIPRRTMLRGVGAALALPWLDSMLPAFSAAAATAQPVKRLGVMYVPNGMSMAYWPSPTEGALEEKTILAPLDAFRDRITVVSGLQNQIAFANDGAPHQRAQGAWTSGVTPKRGEGAAQLGTSFDQIAAQHAGGETQLASLELGLESADIIGACVSGYHCAYNNTLAWKNASTPLPTENNPRAVFERLFGATDRTDRRSRLDAAHRDRSIIDAVLDKVNALSGSVGPSDRDRLEQYLDSLRDVEKRIQRSEEQSGVEVPELAAPAGVPASFEEYAKLMLDLQVIAWQVDVTRVVTFLTGREVSNRSYPEIDVPMSHHALSHHQGDTDKLARLAKVNTLHVGLFRYLVDRLANTSDGDGSLLDHSLLVYGAGMSESNGHVYDNIPTMLVGGKLFGLKGNRQLFHKDAPPFANLQLTVLERMGLPVERFGNSSGTLSVLAGV